MNDERPPTQLLMACLGDASRFRLVQVLMQGARCVSDLAVDVGLSQSCTTRHLQALERRGVVVGAREGKRVLYRLRFDRPELGPLLAWALRLDAGTPVADRVPAEPVKPAPVASVSRADPVPRIRRSRPAAPIVAQAPAEVAARPAAAEPMTAASAEPMTAAAVRRPRRVQDMEDFLL